MRYYHKAFILSALLIALSGFASFAEAAEACRVSYLEGSVSVKETPDVEWADVEVGQDIPQGAQLITNEDAICELAIGDANALRIEANALATVTSLEPVLIDISKGKLYALVRKLKENSSFEVRTPTCIAAARGTAWSQTTESIEVFENTVSAKNKEGEEQEIETGRGISLDAESGAFGDNYELPAETLAEWQKLSATMLSRITLYKNVSITPTEGAPAAKPRQLTGTADRTGAVHGAIGNIQMLMKAIEAKYRPFEEKIQDQVMTLDTVTEGMAIGLKVYRKGEKFRGETNMVMPMEAGEAPMNMNVTMIYDGRDYWSITPMGTMKVPAAQMQKQMQSSEHWWNYLSPRDTFTGEGTAEGRACYVVDLEPGKSLSYTRLWIDKENFRLIQARGPEDGHDYRFTFSDYRNVQGMDMPFKMQMYEDGKLVGEYITTSMQFNVGLPDSLFVVNASGGGMDMQAMIQQAMQGQDLNDE